MGSALSVAAGEIQQMNTTYWAQGSSRAVYVLELGKLSVKAAIEALSKFIGEDISLGNTYQKFFSYLIPANGMKKPHSRRWRTTTPRRDRW